MVFKKGAEFWNTWDGLHNKFIMHIYIA